MNYNPKAQLTEGPVGKTLFKLAIPMVFAALGMVIFNLVDTFFVGKLGAIELAAMSFTFPVVMIVGSLAMGLGIGTSAVISRAIGEGGEDRVKRLTTDALLLALTVGISLSVVGLVLINPIFRWMGATEEILPLIRDYMVIYCVGVWVMVVPMVGNNILRATGDTKTPSIIMMCAVVLNIALDPLLIFGIGPFPRLELTGAALTTVVSRMMTFLLVVSVIHFRKRMITFVRPSLRMVWESWRHILFIGVPAGATSIIPPLAMGVITSLVATYGAETVAGFGAATRIDMLAMIVIMALSTVLAPFVGQNWGAGKQERVKLAITYCLRFALGWGFGMYLLLLIFSTPISLVFNDHPRVVEVMKLYFSIAPLSYGFIGVVMLINSLLNVLRKPLYAAIISIVQMLVLHVPIAYAGSYFIGLVGVFGAVVIANSIASLLAYGMLKRVLREIFSERESESVSGEAHVVTG